jgi:exopolysaccharide biosynthesis polyprenyl glycosylphosphotransferase
MVRVFGHYFSGRKLLFFLAESSAITVAGLLGAATLAWALARPGAAAQIFIGELPRLGLLSAACAVTFQGVLYLLDLYDLRVADQDRRRGLRILKAIGCATAAMAVLALLLRLRMPGGALLGGAMGSAGAVLLVRSRLPVMLGGPSEVLIVGRGAAARWLVQAIETQGENAFRCCAIVDPDSPPASSLELAAGKAEAEYVVATGQNWGAPLANSLLRARASGFKVYDGVAFCERVLRRLPITYLSALDLAFAESLTISAPRRWAKRVFDLVMAIAVLALVAPLMALTALAIKIDSQGPLFYRQERVGRGGGRFVLWKFRSMATDAEKDGAVWARINDERVTRVGRFIRRTRIDELPQVFNVLLGSMSFVGPRPERPVFVDKLKSQVPFYWLRELVKPGITGWAQIRYPYGASIEDAKNKLELDLYYIKHGSLFLDLAIIFHTVRHVLLARGAR